MLSFFLEKFISKFLPVKYKEILYFRFPLRFRFLSQFSDSDFHLECISMKSMRINQRVEKDDFFKIGFLVQLDALGLIKCEFIGGMGSSVFLLLWLVVWLLIIKEKLNKGIRRTTNKSNKSNPFWLNSQCSVQYAWRFWHWKKKKFEQVHRIYSWWLKQMNYIQVLQSSAFQTL